MSDNSSNVLNQGFLVAAAAGDSKTLSRESTNFNIFVKTYNGEVITFRVNGETTVTDIQIYIAGEKGAMTTENLDLIFFGSSLGAL